MRSRNAKWPGKPLANIGCGRRARSFSRRHSHQRHSPLKTQTQIQLNHYSSEEDKSLSARCHSSCNVSNGRGMFCKAELIQLPMITSFTMASITLSASALNSSSSIILPRKSSTAFPHDSTRCFLLSSCATKMRSLNTLIEST